MVVISTPHLEEITMLHVLQAIVRVEAWITLVAMILGAGMIVMDKFVSGLDMSMTLKDYLIFVCKWAGLLALLLIIPIDSILLNLILAVSLTREADRLLRMVVSLTKAAWYALAELKHKTLH